MTLKYILTNLNLRYNKGDIVLGMEFGDHIGDWSVYPKDTMLVI